MTVKTRITLFIAAAGFISSLLFSIIVFYESAEQPFKLLDTVLKEQAKLITRMVVNSQGKSDPGPPDVVLQTAAQYWIELYEQETHRMLFQSSLAKSVKLLPVKPGASSIVRAIIPHQQGPSTQSGPRELTFRVRTFPVELDGRFFVVQIARPIDHLEEEIWELAFGIAAGLIFSTLALIAISRFMAGKILQPIGRMKDLAQEISEKNLDQRLPVGEDQDEFSELARTINRMLDRLQYSFERQRNFLFDTSHELKTPISTIRLAVDEICALKQRKMPPLVKDNLLRLNNQVLRMERLVKDLLNLSVLETLTGIEEKPVQISDLLSFLAGEYQFLAEARNITIDNQFPEGLVIHGDGEKLRRAFSNILDNAVKYNVEGGRIELTGELSVAQLTVTVFNTGPGVDEADIPKVFDQFFRVEKSRSLQHGGSGLGLAIVKRIVELHGGKITFASRHGGGSRVTVSLPV